MKRRFGRNEKGQLHVVEAIVVGILVFTILFVTSVFRLPTSPATFQQAELAGLAHDTLVATLAKPPNVGSDCNETPCPFSSELERMISLALGYRGATVVSSMAEPAREDPSTSEISEYLLQALPPGTRYVLSISNGVATKTIHPANVVPPALDVAVGHLFVSPRWDRYASQVDQSMIIRIGETTGFKTAEINTIKDPLNRETDEDGVAHESRFADATGTEPVPDDAVYGTYQVCRPGPVCTYFTVVPPGIFGAGSSILGADRDNTTTLRSAAGGFDDYVTYFDDLAAPGSFGDEDWMYLDLDSSQTVSARDLRLTSRVCEGTIVCAAGSRVEASHDDVGGALVDLPADLVRAATTGDATKLDEGDGVYFDANGGGVNAGDRRLTRVGTYPFGSIVQSGDADVGAGLAQFSSETVTWGDLDGQADIDVGEPLYLDFAGHGQSAGLEALDIHLSPKGSPTALYLYDVKLVVWYGI